MSKFRSVFPLPPRALLAVIASAGLACGGDDDADKADSETAQREVVEQYAAIVRASYDDSIEAAKELEAAVKELTSDPSEETLEAARQAWLASREPYIQTEGYRFYEGPIDNEETGPEGLINAWPMDESFVDYVEGMPEAGIIQDAETFPTIDKELLLEQNENGGETNVASGYHAIEFLLWGQDQSSDGPGDRPYTDYVESDEGPGQNAERRADYLEAAAELLVENLQEVRDAWDEDADYPEAFLAEPKAALADITLALTYLAETELAGERLQPAYDNRDQEEEHSCFSDNTHRDHILDVQSMENIYFGRYETLEGEKLDGPGLSDLVKAKDPELDDTIQDRLAAAKDAVEAMPVPFDQAIVEDEGRTKVRAAIDALGELAEALSDIDAAIDI